MKKSVAIRIMCLVIALVVLSGAIGYAAIMGSPYETLKKAVLDAFTFHNSTVMTEMSISINGVKIDSEKSYYIQGDNSYLEYEIDDSGNRVINRYQENGFRFDGLTFTSSDGTDWYSAYVSPKSTSFDNGYRYSYFSLTPEDRVSTQMRFFELLIDMLVGDLKNNVTMSAVNGVRTVRGTITANQVPELVKAGIDVMIEQIGNFYYDTREIGYDGEYYITESTRIVNGVATVNVWKQAVRPMTPEEEEAWKTGSISSWDYVFIDDIPYIYNGSRELDDEYTRPATRDDFRSRDPWDIPVKSITIDYIRG